MAKKTFDEVVLFARTGLNPRNNFKLGNGDNKYITIKNIHDGELVIDDNTDVVSDEAINLIHKRSQIKKGDILFCSIGRIGDMYIIENEPEGWDINESVFAFTLNSDIIYQKYFYYIFKNQNTIRLISKNSSGSTFKSIKMNQIKKMVFELPPLEEQKKVINILDNLSLIIKNFEKELKKLDELTKARFVEMFGDLEKNDKGWEERPLLDVCNQLKRYPTFCNMDYLKQGTRVIRIGNILLDGHMDIDDNNYVFVYDSVNEDFPDTVISLDDIVMAVRGDGSAAKRIGIIQEDKLVGANISPNLIRIQANTSVVAPIFLYHYLISEVGQKRLDSYVNKTAKKNIAAKDIAKVKTPVPEMYLQNEYVEFVKQVDKSKVAVQKSLEETQLLFDSLMQEYFG